MKKGQPAFLLPIDQKEIVDELDNEEAGIIFKAIYEYEVNKTEPKLNKTLKIVFKQFKVKLDNYDGAYKEKCIRNKEIITKYWEKKKNTKEYERIRSNTNEYKIKEKKRKEKEIKENKRKVRENIYNNSTPTLSDIINYATDLEIDNQDYCETFFNHYESIGWVNGSGQRIKNWKLVFKNWLLQDKKVNKQENLKKINEGVFKL